ncbi:hypothetical protein B0O99DRAFT_590031 [Bisporella sp. PMI_857]|nr:hypothetical protein B0O99DRAFT_590853 [Bisporella sp. PMI_857]KAH8600353.1 hypothetical protein B0O99DRAFT_590031 [Bisporella sp. PMI_857]
MAPQMQLDGGVVVIGLTSAIASSGVKRNTDMKEITNQRNAQHHRVNACPNLQLGVPAPCLGSASLSANGMACKFKATNAALDHFKQYAFTITGQKAKDEVHKADLSDYQCRT